MARPPLAPPRSDTRRVLRMDEVRRHVRRYDMDDARSGRCCWRVLTPRWASRPLSGEGAAIHGGRWNRNGTPALYLSEPGMFGGPVSTAWAEFQQGLTPRIGTVAPYELRIERLVDLTVAATRDFLGFSEADMACPWKEVFVAGGDPPTWAMAERLRSLDVQAARVPSVVMHGGVNVVVWEMDDRTCDVRVIDPDSALPVDQASWPPVPGPT